MIYNLPELPYHYDALEPYIDTVTMTVHHKRHHQGYVNNLNKAMEDAGIKNKNLEEILKSVSNYPAALRNNAGGHYNHSLFWKILSDTPQMAPQGELAEKIRKTFGGLDELISKITEVGLSQFGSGWAWLIIKEDGNLSVCSTPNQDNPLMDVNSSDRGYPILGLDIWEHAYYIRYQNRRAEYIDNFWLVLDWKAVEKNYEEALSKIKCFSF